MKSYWTTAHDEAIQDYFYSASEEDRSQIVNKKLAKPLYELATRCLTSLGIKPDSEIVQDIVIHLVCKVMPKLTEDKLKGALQYLWISARNYTLTYIIKPKRKLRVIATEVSYSNGRITSCEWNFAEDPVDLEAEYERTALHKKVMAEIDSKLSTQQVFNATNSVFLMLLKQYLVDNDYDVVLASML